MKWGALLLAIILFCIAFVASIIFGQAPIPVKTAFVAFTQYDPESTDHIIIMSTRISRAVIATFIGAGLAIAGALMQALSRNPLASPSILGINAGALFFVVLAVSMSPSLPMVYVMGLAFFGATIASVLVYVLGSIGRSGLSPIKLVMAGAAITALFVSMTQAMLVLDEQNLESVLFWMAGSVGSRELEVVMPLLPWMSVAMIAACLMGGAITILTSGEDIARNLGQRTGLVKLMMGLIIVTLAGGSIAMGGLIGFVGLIVPHMVRPWTGNDHRWLLPFCALVGASLLLLADVVARFLIMPQEVPIGVMTALLGTPFFIYIARKGVAKG